MTAPEVVTLGEAMAGLVASTSGPLATVDTFRRYVVGAEANLAIALVRLGHPAAFVGRVGSDGLGAAIVRRLRGEGVEVTGVSVDADAPTGVLLRERRALGPSEVLYHRRGSAGSRLDPADVRACAGAIRGSRWLHVTGITPALSPTASAAVTEAVGIAREAGATVSFDVNLRRRLWSDAEAARGLASFVDRADVVFGDADELAVIAGGVDPVAVLLGRGVAMVVEKRGAAGAALWDRTGAALESPAVEVRTVVDPIGAGDAFCAGFIAARLEERPLDEAMRWACACGAAVVAVEGDSEGAPTRAELERLLAAARGDTIR